MLSMIITFDFTRRRALCRLIMGMDHNQRIIWRVGFRANAVGIDSANPQIIYVIAAER